MKIIYIMHIKLKIRTFFNNIVDYPVMQVRFGTMKWRPEPWNIPDAWHIATHDFRWFYTQSLEVSKIKKIKKNFEKFWSSIINTLIYYRWPKFFEVFPIFFYFWNFKWLWFYNRSNLFNIYFAPFRICLWIMGWVYSARI